MNIKKLYLSTLILPFLLCQVIQSQRIDSSSFKLNSRLSFYTFEKQGEFVIQIPADMTARILSVNISIGQKSIAAWSGKAVNSLVRIPFNFDLSPSVYRAVATISTPSVPGLIFKASNDLVILSYKSNEVKTDRLTGGLIVNRRDFFPFGFYCYSPVYPTLPEEEIVRGFNMISPYQTILPEKLNERKAYMDRCAELGMKVHYNLLSLSGGGGVGSKKGELSDEEKKVRLVEEIKNFMDHPALLGWYISDEPNGTKVQPEYLREIYRLVKETDPWHPVSMVFMAPFLASKKYADALDIVMADPYPVPTYPITMVGEVTGQLKSEFTGKKPVWMVLQAFGGGEWWGREPTLHELRSMTWQSVIKGATGIQYFVRQGPNYFPKSVAAWDECGRMAMEIAELTPWLLSDEITLPVQSSQPNIIVASRVHNGQLLVMAVNKSNEPSAATIRISGFTGGKARVIFENRSLQVSGGIINDHISAFGSEVYLLDIKPEKQADNGLTENLMKDPGFEESAGTGIPSACYARPGGDRGATYFLDTREHHGGNHSVRLINPGDNNGTSLRFFPVPLKAGKSYGISIWAKSDPEQGFPVVTNQKNIRLYNNNQEGQRTEIRLGDFIISRFNPDGEWRRYMTFVTIPADTLPTVRTNLIIKMTGKGVAWFDDLMVYEEK